MTSKDQTRTSCFTLALQRCNEKPTYTIHGLWPYTRNARLKPLCRLDALSIKSLWKDLDRYHKNCFGNNIQFLEYQWCKHGIYVFSTPSEYFQLALAAYNFVLRKVGRGIKAFESTQLTKKGKKYTNYKIPLLYHQQSDTFEVATCDGRQIKF